MTEKSLKILTEVDNNLSTLSVKIKNRTNIPMRLRIVGSYNAFHDFAAGLCI